MHHYTESGLNNVYLKNGFTKEEIDGEAYTTINHMNGLHKAIAQVIVDSRQPLNKQEFKFLRIELNLSQKVLANRFGVTDQTIARYEKGQSDIPRTTDAALRTLYMESIKKNNPVSYFLELLCDVEAHQAQSKILLEETQEQWRVVI